MTPSVTADFRRLADLMPQPLLLVSGDARVAVANRAATQLLGWAAQDMEGQPLSRVCQNDETAIAALIRAGARSTSPAPGALVLRLADGSALAYRCDGSLYRPRSDDAPALVLLRLRSKQQAVAQFRQLNERIDMLSREIARRRATEAQLRASTQRLQQADRRKDEFLSMLAHELRNPLAPLHMGVQLLERKHGSLPDVARLTRMMARQTRHMVRLIDDLLDVSRLTRGTIELRHDRFVLAQAIEQAVEMQRPALQARGLTLSVKLAQDMPDLHGDLARMVQVFANLLSNAGKFTDSGGSVAIVSRREGDQAVVVVRDTGAGIPAELLPQVFDLFVQGERSLDRSQGGLGVGLTIVRSIVQQHGGTVRASSAGRGCGSQFEVQLPLAPAQAMTEATTVPAPAPLPDKADGSLRLLVVDDNIDAAQTLCSLLESWGHHVACAHDGPAALAHIAGFDPEVLLLDIGLPGMDGYALAQAVRQQPRADDQPRLLVAVTGYGDAAARQRSAAAGYDQHLTKPVDADALARVLQEFVAQRSR
ncbi:hybrid sensor histidine kinase/response regulator [Comamonadaceae bacterium G21597-S1]|nr:hybrid sensor histidine kinase/response regulator [Comamonadaceae bacterium G21597-S1]